MIDMKDPTPDPNSLTRRNFISTTARAAAGAAAVASAIGVPGAGAAPSAPKDSERSETAMVPSTMLGKAKISRVLLGGNLVSGYMHCRDLKYVGPLFRAYVTEAKLMETFKLAEQHGINTVFESGANYVQRYNKEFGGHMQFIPHIQVKQNQDDAALADHIQKQVDTGAVALYVWGVAADTLAQAGAVDRIAKAVELAKKHGLPVGVGGHSLQVPMLCEKNQVPCDFYVKTFHTDKYPSATPKPLRKEFIWLNGGEGWYDNMWCINPEETIEFMKTVAKPWIAFKILAAGAIHPREAFPYAFNNGADFTAVGMFDFQIKQNADLAARAIRLAEKRARPWRA